MPRRDKRGRLVCACGGYWFPHRRGGGACDHSKSRDVHRAYRSGDAEAILTALAEFAWVCPGRPSRSLEAPF